MNKINAIFENKIVYAGNVACPDFVNIMSPCRNAFVKEEDRKKISMVDFPLTEEDITNQKSLGNNG